MAYSDHELYGYGLATAGRVYPKQSETLVLTNPAEPFASPLVVESSDVRFDSPRAAHKPGPSPLVKPASYKARNESNGSGRS